MTAPGAARRGAVIERENPSRTSELVGTVGVSGPERVDAPGPRGPTPRSAAGRPPASRGGSPRWPPAPTRSPGDSTTVAELLAREIGQGARRLPRRARVRRHVPALGRRARPGGVRGSGDRRRGRSAAAAAPAVRRGRRDHAVERADHPHPAQGRPRPSPPATRWWSSPRRWPRWRSREVLRLLAGALPDGDAVRSSTATPPPVRRWSGTRWCARWRSPAAARRPGRWRRPRPPRPHRSCWSWAATTRRSSCRTPTWAPSRCAGWSWRVSPPAARCAWPPSACTCTAAAATSSSRRTGPPRRTGAARR